MTTLAALAKLATTGRQQSDHAAWETWKKSPTDANASALLAQVSPLIHREANKWSGTFCDFSGQEYIEVETLKDEMVSDWNYAFWHRYHGMMLLPGYDIGK